jgi:DHA2 family methylenomycin A resistance protein-like MFS transporter
MYVLLSNLVMYTTLLTIPFFLEEVQDHNHATTGAVLGSMSIISAAIAPIGGRFSDAAGRRLPAAIGSVIILTAVVALAMGISEDVSPTYLGVCLAILGLGMGLSFGAASTAAIETAPRDLAGAAAGTNSMMRYLGSIVGAGILGAVLNKDSGNTDIALFQFIFYVLVVMAAAASATTFFIHTHISGRSALSASDREAPIAVAPEGAHRA